MRPSKSKSICIHLLRTLFHYAYQTGHCVTFTDQLLFLSLCFSWKQGRKTSKRQKVALAANGHCRDGNQESSSDSVGVVIGCKRANPRLLIGIQRTEKLRRIRDLTTSKQSLVTYNRARYPIWRGNLKGKTQELPLAPCGMLYIHSKQHQTSILSVSIVGSHSLRENLQDLPVVTVANTTWRAPCPTIIRATPCCTSSSTSMTTWTQASATPDWRITIFTSCIFNRYGPVHHLAVWQWKKVQIRSSNEVKA